MKRGRYQAESNLRSFCKLLLPLAVIMVIVLFFIRMAWTASFSPAAEATPVSKLENSTAIPGYESLTLKADERKQEAVFYNPPENTCLFRISLILEDGTLLWTSKEIKPGKNSDPIRLLQPLSAGQYPNTVLKYECFAMDADKTPLNGAEIKLTLRVK